MITHELSRIRRDTISAQQRAVAPAGYRVCSRCVMDTSDRDIVFDEFGVCNHCHVYAEQAASRLQAPQDAKAAFKRIVAEMKSAGVGGEYDCILGVSGGVDSTYTAYVLKKAGLRVLA